MPIIGNVGRKSLKVRILNIAIHLILILGSLTMIYPFLMMISASFKSAVDSKGFSLYPRYFLEDKVLFQKYIEARMNEESSQFIEQYQNRYIAFDYLQPPAEPVENLYSDWTVFISENGGNYQLTDFYVSEQFGRGVYPRNERKFRNLMKSESNGDLELFNQRYNASMLSWDEVRIEEKNILSRNYSSAYQGYLLRYIDFKQDLPNHDKVFASIDGHFLSNELIPAYRGKLELLNASLETSFAEWKNIVLPATIPEGKMREHWIKYVKYRLNINHVKAVNKALPAYQNFLKSKYSEIELLNMTYKSSYPDFSTLALPEKLPAAGALLVDWIFFIENLAEPEHLYVTGIQYDFRNWLKARYYSIDELNGIYEKGFKNFSEIPLSTEFPEHNLSLQKDWSEFVKNEVPASKIRVLMTAQQYFFDFLTAKYPSKDLKIDLDKLNSQYDTNYQNQINIYPSAEIPEQMLQQKDWQEFVNDYLPPRFILVDESQEGQWQDFLEQKYNNDIEALNLQYQLIYQDFDEIDIDNLTIDYYTFKEHKWNIFGEFLTRNYIMVLDLMLYNGRAIVNTLIYCFLAILTAVIVNPLAAYAMSRFKLRMTYQIMLVLMLTMAFPPMVMAIPNFLLLKNLNLLNTFWALVLPAAADGYFIFLLKGFFDSLPKELFESATIDGAGEFRMFRQIALALSKPIMAVIALGAFNAAYRNFMFAFIVCQDKSMWTMMVHIYQLIQRSSPAVGFAALVIAAIPTFLVFVFFQNMIIRGIVVPTEK